LIGQYRKRTVIAMPPPSSGGVALLQMLSVLEGHGLNKLPHNEGTYLHLLAEAMKHAFADRAQYLGDPDYVKAPMAMLLSKDYAAWIRGRISPVKTQPPNSTVWSISKRNRAARHTSALSTASATRLPARSPSIPVSIESHGAQGRHRAQQHDG
jgi:gamma-glutamyltranspeptidase